MSRKILQASSMLTKEDLKRDDNIPEWLKNEYSYWEKVVSDSNFPCHFGTASERKGDLRYFYIENHDLSPLPDVLRKFLTLSRENEHNKLALVVFVQPETPEQSFDYYEEYFWNILKYLNRHDKKEWPSNIPTNPDDPLWEFCFDGEPIFVSVNMPAYKNRITRNTGKSLILIFQPRRIFADITSKAVNLIRSKVESIENLPSHPDLGKYGDENSREWKQYIITDDNNPRIGVCPFHPKS
ncbi:MAG: YqcI/YcgG family protein [Bacillales bacterium]|nr:YqcI/YcgG family protein [Bacillales bacterium]